MRLHGIASGLALAGLLAACSPASPPADVPGETAQPSADEAAVRAVVQRFYQVSSFDAPDPALADSFRLPFTPDARLASARRGRVSSYSVDEYVERRREMLASGEVRFLHEWELAGETEVFGNLAHHWSAYAVYVNSTDSVSERGVMAFQLVKLDGSWLIHALTWDAETPENPLPEAWRGGT